MHVSDTPPVIIRPQVLIVDDDAAVLTALSSLLSSRLEPQILVDTAASGEEALALLAAPPRAGEVRALALVVSDEKMPGMTGNDLLCALRRDESHRDGGRIMITGYAGLPSVTRAINDSRVDKYFPKPWNAEDVMVPAVTAILRRFIHLRGLETFLWSECRPGDADLAPVLEVRRQWWLHVVRLGETPDEGLPAVERFAVAGDREAAHLLLWRRGDGADRVAAAVRLSAGAAGWTLDQVAFSPAEADAAAESLLVRAALLEARHRGGREVRTVAPRLRRDLYLALGFAEVDGSAGGQACALCVNFPAPAMSAADAADAFSRRFLRDRGLCACAQTGCPARDYAAATRGYYCPFDVVTGRVPADFLLGGLR
jgi:two-component system, chemotaxis family, chemotaxis protein CheY